MKHTISAGVNIEKILHGFPSTVQNNPEPLKANADVNILGLSYVMKRAAHWPLPVSVSRIFIY